VTGDGAGGRGPGSTGRLGSERRTESARRRASRLVLAVVMVSAGVLHFVAPRAYEPLIPPALGAARPWVLGSGVAEIAAGTLLAVPRTRRAGAWAVAAVFVGVFPGNVWMALEPHPAGGLAANPVITWLRLPLQVPLILWALAHTGWRRRR